MSQHPFIHPKLVDFSYLSSFPDLVSSDEVALQFLEEVGIVPSRSSTPPTCECGDAMVVEEALQKKLGWIWRCSSKKIKKISKKKKTSRCTKTINPSSGTFVDGKACHISIREVLAIVILFVTKMKFSETYKHLHRWRNQSGANIISQSTVNDYYSYCREIAEVISSHCDICLGGAGKTV